MSAAAAHVPRYRRRVLRQSGHPAARWASGETPRLLGNDTEPRVPEIAREEHSLHLYLRPVVVELLAGCRGGGEGGFCSAGF